MKDLHSCFQFTVQQITLICTAEIFLENFPTLGKQFPVEISETTIVNCVRVCYDDDGDVSLDTKRKSFGKLSHGFEWIAADETISVDLDLKDPNTAMFLELLYFTQVICICSAG